MSNGRPVKVLRAEVDPAVAVDQFVSGTAAGGRAGQPGVEAAQVLQQAVALQQHRTVRGVRDNGVTTRVTSLLSNIVSRSISGNKPQLHCGPAQPCIMCSDDWADLRSGIVKRNTSNSFLMPGLNRPE